MIVGRLRDTGRTETVRCPATRLSPVVRPAGSCPSADIRVTPSLTRVTPETVARTAATLICIRRWPQCLPDGRPKTPRVHTRQARTPRPRREARHLRANSRGVAGSIRERPAYAHIRRFPTETWGSAAFRAQISFAHRPSLTARLQAVLPVPPATLWPKHPDRRTAGKCPFPSRESSHRSPQQARQCPFKRRRPHTPPEPRAPPKVALLFATSPHGGNFASSLLAHLP